MYDSDIDTTDATGEYYVASNVVKDHIHGMVNNARNDSTYNYSHYVAEHDPYHAYSDGTFRLNNADLNNSLAWQYVDFLNSRYSIVEHLRTLISNTDFAMNSGELPGISGLGVSGSKGSKFDPWIISKDSNSSVTTEIDGNACILEGYRWNDYSNKYELYGDVGIGVSYIEKEYYVLTSSVKASIERSG